MFEAISFVIFFIVCLLSVKEFGQTSLQSGFFGDTTDLDLETHLTIGQHFIRILSQWLLPHHSAGKFFIFLCPKLEPSEK